MPWTPPPGGVDEEQRNRPGTGIAWLEKGGVYVVANIRGGGEFGPKWHQAALKQNRHKAYEDVIAVAEDLVKRKVTSSAHLGIMGGSNGGLLMGNMLTMRPDLFGAIELQSIGGPTRCETPYLVRAKVLALSESPKTENVWYRAWAADPATGEDVCSMLMYLRYMKASSKHYGA